MKAFIFLKRLRVVVSLVFLVLIFFLFIDFTNLFSSAIVEGILFFQFVPSFIKFINITGIIVSGYIIVLIFILLFGRVYCSSFCPLGALQDVLSFFSKKFGKKKMFRYSKPYHLPGYSILIITLILLAFGSLLFVNLLDPYSLFGKFISDLARPVYYGVNNLLAFVLEPLEIYTIYPVKLKAYNWISFGFSIFMLFLVIRLSLKKGRLYCNTVCPVGTFFGLISRISVFKIVLDETTCTSCGICGSQCKAECINTLDKTVDFSRCVGCFNCLTVCPGNGVLFKRSWFSKPPDLVKAELNQGNGRRMFLFRSSSFLIGLLSVAGNLSGQIPAKGKKEVVKKYAVTPPGSLNADHFHENCTACHLCVSACPTHVLQPSVTEYGWDGLFQPTMDYNASFCNYECKVCCDICPTGAIMSLPIWQKKRTQLGKATFIKENCIVYTDETACGACSEHCPTKAVNMIFYKGRLTIPEVTDKICIGCGACEYACPTTPLSIYVEGNPVHLLSEKPKEIKSVKPVSPAKDFPF